MLLLKAIFSYVLDNWIPFLRGGVGNPLAALNGKPIRSQQEEDPICSIMGSLFKGFDGVDCRIRAQLSSFHWSAA